MKTNITSCHSLDLDWKMQNVELVLAISIYYKLFKLIDLLGYIFSYPVYRSINTQTHTDTQTHTQTPADEYSMVAVGKPHYNNEQLL